MKEFKGTKGPWFVEDEEFSSAGEDAIITCQSRYGMVGICQIRQGGSEREADNSFSDEQVANANIIAAAPELLEALIEMVAIVKKNTYPQPDKPSSTWGRMESAESVIAKALGE